MMTKFQCTECDEVHDRFDDAARCHWGIGGVIEVEDPTFSPAVETFLDNVMPSLDW